MIAIAATELKTQIGITSMYSLYPAIVGVCQQRGICLFPAPDETEFHNHLRRAKGKTIKQLVDAGNQNFFANSVLRATIIQRNDG